MKAGLPINECVIKAMNFRLPMARSRQKLFPLHHVLVGERVRVRGRQVLTLTPPSLPSEWERELILGGLNRLLH